MARARLHIICGNCGCNDMWEWEHIPYEFVDYLTRQDEDVYLRCGNCATLHSLNDNAKKKEV
jgi:hypothetical protein